MAGLLAVSWHQGGEGEARRRFARACEAMASVKGLPCSGRAESRGVAVARFAAPRSPAPEVLVRPDALWAAAGWWFDPDAADGVGTLAGLAAGGDPARVLARLQGQYLVVAVDAMAGRLRAAGDRLGLYPVYVAEGRGLAWLSTSALALAAALDRPLDRQALAALFVGDAIRSPQSAFEGVRRLGMGEEVDATDGRLTVRRVWTPYRTPRAFRRVDDAVDEALAILDRSCAAISRQFPRWVADLTAGLDSRLVVAAMAPHGAVRTTVNGPDEHLDVRISRHISDTLGWAMFRRPPPADWGRQRWRHFRHGVALGDGELGGQALDGTVEAKLALAPYFDAALSGGGGELLRDFFWTQEFLARGRTTKLDIQRLLRYRFLFSHPGDPGLLTPGWRQAWLDDQAERMSDLVQLAPDALNTAKLDAIYLWKSSGHIGRYQGASFPLIVSPMPLATAALVELSLALPYGMRLHSRFVRQLITRLHPRLAAMATSYGGSAQPLSPRRPGDLLRYGSGAVQKLVRKLGQVTVGHPLLPDPTARPPDPRAEPGLVAALERSGWLDRDNLRTRWLYRDEGLTRLLSAARDGTLRDFGPLHALISVEWLARLCAQPRLADRLRQGGD